MLRAEKGMPWMVFAGSMVDQSLSLFAPLIWLIIHPVLQACLRQKLTIRKIDFGAQRSNFFLPELTLTFRPILSVYFIVFMLCGLQP